MDAHTHRDILRTNCNVQTHAMSTGGHGDESSACFLNMGMGVGGGELGSVGGNTGYKVFSLAFITMRIDDLGAKWKPESDSYLPNIT